MAELERRKFTAEEGVSIDLHWLHASLTLHVQDHLTLLNGSFGALAHKQGILFVGSLQCFCSLRLVIQVLRTARNELSSAIKSRQRPRAAEAVYATLWHMAARKACIPPIIVMRPHSFVATAAKVMGKDFESVLSVVMLMAAMLRNGQPTGHTEH
jgi:hypothetical protein